MSRDFFPRADAQAVAYTANFSNRLNARPELYRVTPERAAAYAAMQLAYAERHQASAVPGTATQAGRAARREARRILERETRAIASVIRAASSIPLQDKLVIGVKPRSAQRRIPRPKAAPTVRVRCAVGSILTIDLLDSDIDTRRLPADVPRALLFLTLDSTQPFPTAANPGKLRITSRTRTRIELAKSFPAEQLTPGTKVWIRAAWTNPRGEQSPLSTPTAAQVGLEAMSLRPSLRAA